MDNERVCVAITGLIGSGKSTISARFNTQYGATVIDMDKVAHSLYDTRDDVVEMIATAFGDGIRSERSINRKILGSLVFGKGNEDNMKRLEAIVWPALAEELERKKQQYTGLVCVEAAVLYESRWEERMDGVIFVDCQDQMRKERIMIRNNLSAGEAQQRMDSQWSSERMRQRTAEIGGYVIDNSFSVAEADDQIWNVYEDLCRRFPGLVKGSS